MTTVNSFLRVCRLTKSLNLLIVRTEDFFEDLIRLKSPERKYGHGQTMVTIPFYTLYIPFTPLLSLCHLSLLPMFIGGRQEIYIVQWFVSTLSSPLVDK